MSGLTPGSPEWARLVTASKVSDILGLSPWGSPYAMWRKMRGDVPWDEESRPMRRGNMLENAILDWWLADNPEWVEVERQPIFRLDGEDWCLATPDMLVQHVDTGEQMLVDAKTTGKDWDWQVEVPAYYAASSMFQLAMAPKVPRVCLAVLFGDPFDLRSYYVDRDDQLIDGLLTMCREFYDSLDADDPPPLDDSVATYDVVRKLHPDIDRDVEVQLSDAEADEFVEAAAALKAADARARAARSVVLERMGAARLAKNNGQTIARRQPGKHGVSLVAVAKPTPQENVA